METTIVVNHGNDFPVVVMGKWGGWHQRSRSLDQPGRALLVSTFGDPNDATC